MDQAAGKDYPDQPQTHLTHASLSSVWRGYMRSEHWVSEIRPPKGKTLYVNAPCVQLP